MPAFNSYTPVWDNNKKRHKITSEGKRWWWWGREGGSNTSQVVREHRCREKKKKSKVVLLTCWITYRPALISISIPNTHSSCCLQNIHILVSRWSQSYHLNLFNATCRGAHWHTWLRDFDALYLIMNYASAAVTLKNAITSVIRQMGRFCLAYATHPLSPVWGEKHTHKQGMWKCLCINSQEEAKSLRSL